MTGGSLEKRGSGFSKHGEKVFLTHLRTACCCDVKAELCSVFFPKENRDSLPFRTNHTLSFYTITALQQFLRYITIDNDEFYIH